MRKKSVLMTICLIGFRYNLTAPFGAHNGEKKMLLYAIGDKIAIDASQISLFELMLIASRHKEDSVLLVESNDKNSIYACKDDLVIRYELSLIHI